MREYDAGGNMTVVKEEIGGQVNTIAALTYDTSNRLKTYTGDDLLTTMAYDSR